VCIRRLPVPEVCAVTRRLGRCPRRTRCAVSDARGLLAADPATMAGVTRLMRPGAVLSLLVSATERDSGLGVEPIRDGTLHRVADAYGDHGLTVTEARPATVADVTAAHSTWGKRLGVGVGRQAWLLRGHDARTPGCRGSAAVHERGNQRHLRSDDRVQERPVWGEGPDASPSPRSWQPVSDVVVVD
jgi:hypothetical protein